MPKALVAGATGYLGRHVVSAFAAARWTVRAIARSEDKLAPVRAHVAEPVLVEATKPGALAGACDGVDVVFSSLGITRQTDKVTYETVDYGANRALLDEAVRAGCPRFVFVSVLHPELTRHLPMVAARERLVDELRAAPIRSVVMRPTGFFADIAEVFHMAQKGRAWVFGDGSHHINPIHGADLADACVEAATAEADTIEIGGPEVFTQQAIAELAFEVLAKPPVVSHMPDLLVDAALPVVHAFNRRWWTIAAFISTAGRHEMVGPRRGTHRLRTFFEDLAAPEK